MYSLRSGRRDGDRDPIVECTERFEVRPERGLTESVITVSYSNPIATSSPLGLLIVHPYEYHPIYVCVAAYPEPVYSAFRRARSVFNSNKPRVSSPRGGALRRQPKSIEYRRDAHCLGSDL